MKRMIFVGLSTLMICAALLLILLYYCFSEYYHNLFVFVPVYFIVFFVVEFALLNVYRKDSGAKKLNIFLLFKVVKFFVSICILFLWIKFIDKNNISFSSVFLILYFVSLMLEAIGFSKIMKKNE